MTRPVRVAHVVHDLRPGGTERRLLAVVRGLDRTRFDPLLVCINGLGELEGEARALGVEPHVIGRAHRFDARSVARLARLLRRERVQIVHGWLSLASVFARLAAVPARVPVRIAAEGGAVTTRDSRRAARDRTIERALAPLTDAYVANSEAVAASLRANGVPDRKIAVVPNGVEVRPAHDPEERRRIRASLGAGDGDVLVGMVARLDPGFKDHSTFLEVVAGLARDGRPVRAAVVGVGSAADRGTLEAQARELGVDGRVVFTGYRPDAAELIGVLDVSVLLSYSEGFSNVVLETMAAGVPFVGTRIPPIEEAVEDGAHALLVPVGDREATTGALRRLLDDPALAARLAAAARERATARFSLEAQAAATMALYDRLLARRRDR